MTTVLLGLRFLLELALLSAAAIVGWSAVDGLLLRTLAAAALVVATAAVWGLLLSPRRRVDLPLPVRLGVELLLFMLAAAGLAGMGHGAWGLTLMAGEIAVVVALIAVGRPPGADPAAGG